MISTEIAALDSTLRKENKASELGPRLETIPSIGPVIASAFRARVTDPKLFENGRHLSAWIGIVLDASGTPCCAAEPPEKGRGSSVIRIGHIAQLSLEFIDKTGWPK